MKDMDWAFIPYWIMLDAQEKGIKIDTKMFGIYHLYPGQTGTNESPDRIILMTNQGEVIRILY